MASFLIVAGKEMKEIRTPWFRQVSMKNSFKEYYRDALCSRSFINNCLFYGKGRFDGNHFKLDALLPTNYGELNRIVHGPLGEKLIKVVHTGYLMPFHYEWAPPKSSRPFFAHQG
jgi:hypothetical protein